MRYSTLFGKTVRRPERDMISVNHELLHRGGFIRQISAGRFAFLPLGFRVWQKIYNIIKAEMDSTGVQQLITPTLHPISFWEKTNRDKAFGKEMMTVEDHHGARFALGGTAEGMMVELVNMFSPSYKNLPILIYQFSSKFRDEKRPRGGLLRLREFMMKDAYSFAATENESLKIYRRFYNSYARIAKKLGLDTVPCLSVSGAIGGDYNHEFMVPSKSGESYYYICSGCDFSVTEDYVVEKNVSLEEPCPECNKGTLTKHKAIEWGHVFKQDLFYTKPHKGNFTDKNGKKKPLWMGAYGIGVGRSMATIVEVHHDDKGIIWPKSVSPFDVHLISLGRKDKTSRVYKQLTNKGIDVLFDDREDASAGEKFADCDLIGIPVRLVVSEKTGDKVEWKKRSSDKAKLVDLQDMFGGKL